MKWNLDLSHSNVAFSVRHMGFSTVRGSFKDFSVEVDSDGDMNPTNVRAVIDVASIDTANADRDAHLASGDFFNAEANPKIVFESTEITKVADGEYDVAGTLSMAGQSQPFTFRTEVQGPVTDPWGNPRFSAEFAGKLKRSEWGLTWNQVLEAGGLLVSDDVKFDIAVEVVGSAE